jgi:Transcription regulator GlnR, N-terminal domain
VSTRVRTIRTRTQGRGGPNPSCKSQTCNALESSDEHRIHHRDEVDSKSVLPGLPLQFRAVRTAPLGQAARVEAETAHVAIVDALTDLSRAREVCQRLAATQRSVAVVAVVYDGVLASTSISPRSSLPIQKAGQQPRQ